MDAEELRALEAHRGELSARRSETLRPTPRRPEWSRSTRRWLAI